jgi:hypothetical protein
MLDNAEEKETYDNLKRRLNLILDGIITEKDNAEEISSVEASLLGVGKKKKGTGELEFIKNFQNTALMISQKTNMDVKGMTVFEFYAVLESLKKQAEQAKRQNNGRKSY